ncbi:MAG: HoxN/HupN/NixA family nickel/cobalt transporter [Candidatus Thermoplasmatota archaeon]|jgi:high-affinity nickel-transport protein|nr:HoxN/HupN/NixA family nickel/cobalt transporter [Candidatus Thermoplasmatota archaeon]
MEAVSAEAPQVALSKGEVTGVILLYVAIGISTAVAIALSITIGNAYPILAGLGVVSFILGLRHGFDADHIAAIDNTTRKLLNQGEKPLTVGTWFSLGHSTIIAGLLVALVVATDFIANNITNFAAYGAVIGTVISGVFLCIIGFINLLIVFELYGTFHGLRSGKLDQARLEEQLNQRGFMNRIFGGLFRFVNKPWQIYPIGILFGLGFDTATEVAFLALGVTAATAFNHPPLWTIMILPFMFTCGMVLSDTTDGVSMRYAYGWAFLNPIRKIYYNLTITVISVLVAFLIGGVEFLQVISRELGWSGPVWATLQGISFTRLGLLIIGVFLVAWIVAMAVYRLKGYERTGFGAAPSGPPQKEPEPTVT